MKVKKYKGNTMPEVMQLVRKELGADAVILNSKEMYEGGFLGLFKKKKIEVVAAIDPTPVKPTKQKDTRNHIDTRNVYKQDEVLSEIREMKRWIQQTSKPEHDLPIIFQELLSVLINQEVDKEIADELIEQIMKRHENEKESDLSIEKLKKEIQFEIKHRLANKGSFGGSFDNQVIHLVGPTGVGKTTTIAKLAADCVLNQNKRVAFITTDTFRIAAIEQLKTYAKILDVPIEVAYNLDDYRKAKDKFKEYDYIFVDTAGRNFRDEKYVQELNTIIDMKEKVDSYLVLSLTSRTVDMDNIYQQFKNVPIKQLIFTKQDETSIYGPLLNLSDKYNLGIAYITNGQEVPDDIERISLEEIAMLIVGD